MYSYYRIKKRYGEVFFLLASDLYLVFQRLAVYLAFFFFLQIVRHQSPPGSIVARSLKMAKRGGGGGDSDAAAAPAGAAGQSTRMTVAATNEARRRVESNLAFIMMGYVLVFLICHFPRIMLSILELQNIR